MADPVPARSSRSDTTTPGRHWRKYFLETLAATSSVARAAEVARVTLARAYDARRADADFARAWQAATADGYINLELEVIRRLREGDLMTANGDKFDFANAIRLPAAYRDRAGRGQSEDRVAVRIAGDWHFIEPVQGTALFDQAAEAVMVFRSGWRVALPPPLPSGGTIIDAEARTAISALIVALKALGILAG